MIVWHLNNTRPQKLETIRMPQTDKMSILVLLIILIITIIITLIAGCSRSMYTIDSGAKQSEQLVVKHPYKDNRHMVGGPCEYAKYRGKAVIISIIPKKTHNYSAGPLYEGYEVKYRFVAEEEIKELHGKVEAKEYVLTLANTWYPGPKFLNKYGIEVGKRFECFLHVITKGVCTPIMFDFPDIDQSDYLEIER